MSHTPAPWTQDEYGSVKTPSGQTLLVEGVALSGASTEETRANTRLIAAAPDLLSSVKDLLFIGNLVDEERQNVITGAVAAIKKAEGL